jgi:glutathione reductase (NADPH)
VRAQVTVLGAGFIALEFGGIFRRFGAETHVCFRAPLPLRGFDDEVTPHNPGGLD